MSDKVKRKRCGICKGVCFSARRMKHVNLRDLLSSKAITMNVIALDLQITDHT